MPILNMIYGATGGGGGGWQPGVNTKVYIPMKTDLLDHSGSGVTINNSNVTIVDGAGYFGGGEKELYFTNSSNMSGDWTILVWFKTGSNIDQYFFTQGTENYKRFLHLGYGNNTSDGLKFGVWGADLATNSVSGADNNWHLVSFSHSSAGKCVIYLDGLLSKSGTITGLQTGNNTGHIGKFPPNVPTIFDGYMSERIYEDKVRTAQEISDYYDQTKGDYGIS